MNRLYRIYNLDKRRCWRDHNALLDVTVGLKKMLKSGGAVGLTFKLLNGITTDLPEDPLKGHSYVPAMRQYAELSGLCDLPVELQASILDELQDPTDVFAFSLCSIQCWMVGVRRLRALHIQYILRENYAGDRIIVLADREIKFPEGILTDAELEAHYRPVDVFEHEPPPTYFDYGEIMERCPIYDPETRTCRWRCLYKYVLWMGTEGTTCHHAKPDSPWALRNLTKKVYVRADKLALKPEHIGPEPWTIRGMSFGSLVASRTAWFPEWSIATTHLDKDSDMPRGTWAGDRFDIVDIHDIEEGWADVSAKAKEELGKLWKSEFGDNWEELVVRHGL